MKQIPFTKHSELIVGAWKIERGILHVDKEDAIWSFKNQILQIEGGIEIIRIYKDSSMYRQFHFQIEGTNLIQRIWTKTPRFRKFKVSNAVYAALREMGFTTYEQGEDKFDLPEVQIESDRNLEEEAIQFGESYDILKEVIADKDWDIAEDLLKEMTSFVKRIKKVESQIVKEETPTE